MNSCIHVAIHLNYDTDSSDGDHVFLPRAADGKEKY